MKKNSTKTQSSKRSKKAAEPNTIGMDLGDKSSRYCVLDSSGEVRLEAAVATTRPGLQGAFGKMSRCRIAMEVGTHSPWVSRLLKQFGHEVIVANARQVRLISESSRKNDRLDARMLARMARVDLGLLRPIQHRSESAQGHLLTIHVRAVLVKTRTALVNAARGFSKAFGERLDGCAAESLKVALLDGLPEELRQALRPLVEQVEALTQQIKQHDTKIEQIAREHCPETALLKQVSGVGTLIAATFVLTVEDRERFQKSRDVGCYVGLRPKQSQSGAADPQLRITKEGDRYLRSLLVQGAHYILGWRGPDTDLRRWGLRLCARGGKNAKKRAIVAVARKLAVLLHRLWVTGEVYEPLRNSLAGQPAKRQAA
ncbi:MAG: IS110 family transposase [Acidobacteriota bacterium]